MGREGEGRGRKESPPVVSDGGRSGRALASYTTPRRDGRQLHAAGGGGSGGRGRSTVLLPARPRQVTGHRRPPHLGGGRWRGGKKGTMAATGAWKGNGSPSWVDHHSRDTRPLPTPPPPCQHKRWWGGRRARPWVQPAQRRPRGTRLHYAAHAGVVGRLVCASLRKTPPTHAHEEKEREQMGDIRKMKDTLTYFKKNCFIFFLRVCQS